MDGTFPIARIDDVSAADGRFAESMAAALVQTSDDAKVVLEAFPAKQPPNFGA